MQAAALSQMRYSTGWQIRDMQQVSSLRWPFPHWQEKKLKLGYLPYSLLYSSICLWDIPPSTMTLWIVVLFKGFESIVFLVRHLFSEEWAHWKNRSKDCSSKTIPSRFYYHSDWEDLTNLLKVVHSSSQRMTVRYWLETPLHFDWLLKSDLANFFANIPYYYNTFE